MASLEAASSWHGKNGIVENIQAENACVFQPVQFPRLHSNTFPAHSRYEEESKNNDSMREHRAGMLLHIEYMRTEISQVEVKLQQVAEDLSVCHDETKRHMATRVQLKAEIFNELKAEILDELHTKLQMPVLEKQETDKSPPAPVIETLEPVQLAKVITPGSPSPINESGSDTCKNKLNYQVSNSIWDLAWFIGIEEVGHGGSGMVSILYALNLVMQVSFCIILHRNFGGNDFSEKAIDGLNDFRLANAHDYRYYDRMFGKSLIQHICLQDAEYAQNLMVYGARQLEVLKTVKDYLGDEADGILSFFVGQYMCVLALTCWIFCALRNLKHIWLCFAALAAIPRGPHTVIRFGEIGVLARSRFVCIVGIQLQEIAICIALLIYGCIWLSRTSDIQELLLNAAALDFVLSVDEMIFDALAPRPSQAFIASMAPLSVIGWHSCQGIDLLSGASTLSLVFVVIFFYGNFVSPLVSQMKAAKSALCDFDLDFTYGIDLRNLVWIERPSTTDANKRLWAATPNFLRDVIRKRPNQQASFVGNLPYAFDTTVVKANTLANAGALQYPDQLNPDCFDLLPSNRWSQHPPSVLQAQTFLHFLRVFTNNFSISSCQDVLQMGLCSTVGHPAITLCSQSCGCSLPNSTVFSHSPTYGCPTACLKTNIYRLSLARLRPNCTDFAFGELQKSRFWNGWTVQLVQSFNITLAKILASNMATLGCDFLKHHMSVLERRDVCEGKFFFYQRPLSPICPASCHCSLSSVEFCSPRCSSPVAPI